MTQGPNPLTATAPARLLICGFGPFPSFPDNPAARVVERLRAANWAPEGAVAAYQIIPTTWDGGFGAAADAAAVFEAHGVLVLGVAGGAEGFRIETCARNHAATDKPDAAGFRHPLARISVAGPSIVFSPAPVQAMVAAIDREGLPARPSEDAGDYLCNQVFYRLLTDSRPSSPPTAFVHLPPGLSLDDLERGTRAAASALVLGLNQGEPR